MDAWRYGVLAYSPVPRDNLRLYSLFVNLSRRQLALIPMAMLSIYMLNSVLSQVHCPLCECLSNDHGQCESYELESPRYLFIRALNR